MKTNYFFSLALFSLLCFASCNKEDYTSDEETNTSVDINEDGTTSNGSRFIGIDDRNFYLDYIKYSVEEGHLKVSGYDKSGFSGEAHIVSGVTYKGNSYEVLSIGDSAFFNCIDLTSITIPTSVKRIGRRAFYGCSKFTYIKIPASVTNYAYAFYGCNGPISVTLPDTITSIIDYAFIGCNGMKNIIIPNNVKRIGNNAFDGCSALTSINIPRSVTDIGNAAFFGCSALTSINIPESVTCIGNDAFSSCVGITSIIIPKGVTTIGNNAFEDCWSLTSITIPESVTYIGTNAFFYCNQLSKVIISDIAAWCKIPFEIYYDYKNYRYYLSNPLQFAHHIYSDENTEIKELIIPEGVDSIGSYAFYGCSSLTSVTISRNVTTIGRSAFFGCSELTSIYCKSITPPLLSSYAFYNVPSSTTLYVPKGTYETYKNSMWETYFNNIVEEE